MVYSLCSDLLHSQDWQKTKQMKEENQQLSNAGEVSPYIYKESILFKHFTLKLLVYSTAQLFLFTFGQFFLHS